LLQLFSFWVLRRGGTVLARETCLWTPLGDFRHPSPQT